MKRNISAGIPVPKLIFTARKRSLRRLCFYRCLSFCPQGGGMHGCSRGCAWLLSGGWGHVWLLQGGMRDCSGGVCDCSGGHAWLLQGGHVWLLWGACIVAQGSMCGCSWGVCVVAPRGACMVALRGCMVAPRGHAWLLLGGHVWDTKRYGETINEWAVHILLECILVLDTDINISPTVVIL